MTFQIHSPQGWVAPAMGSYKAGVVESDSALDGYNAVRKEGTSLASRLVIEGEDKDGAKTRCRIQISVHPGQEMLVVLNQVAIA